MASKGHFGFKWDRLLDLEGLDPKRRYFTVFFYGENDFVAATKRLSI